MIAIRRNTTRGLFLACGILLLSMTHGSCAMSASQATLGSPPVPSQNRHPEGGQPVVKDLKFTHLTTNDGLSQGYVVAILQDRRGFMWFATRDSLNRYDGNAFVVFKNNPNDSMSLSSNFIQDLMEDDHGFLWIATNTGLNKFDPASERCIR